MPAKKSAAVAWISPELVTMRYPKLIEAHAPDAKFDAGKHTVTVFLPKNNKSLVKQVQDAIAAAAVDFPAKAVWHNPLRDGDTKIDDETGDPKPGYEGQWFFSAKTGEAYPPKVFNARNEIITDPDVVDNLISFEGKVFVNFKPYESGMGKGVTAYLSQVQVVKAGDTRATACAFDAAEDEDYAF
jgi:hypothetical protein